MKKAILIAAMALVGLLGSAAHADERRAGEQMWTILLVGGPEDNHVKIDLTPDGRSYVIDSKAVLEAPEGVCVHPPELPTQLVCEAPPVAGFEVNAGAGDDAIILAPQVPVPVTLRGGSGEDRLLGGAKGDKLIGGGGDDSLYGRGGDDSLFGGPGADRLFGQQGDDRLRGGPGRDRVVGGPGRDNRLKRD